MTDGFAATKAVIAALEKLGIPYMLVGGLSSMAYGIPRTRTSSSPSTGPD